MRMLLSVYKILLWILTKLEEQHRAINLVTARQRRNAGRQAGRMAGRQAVRRADRARRPTEPMYSRNGKSFVPVTSCGIPRKCVCAVSYTHLTLPTMPDV